ncbi:MAG: DUF6427 family protein [Mucilaginibacter sp.]
MINIFRKYNPINTLWLAILLIVLRMGYIWHAPPQVEFAFVEPFARLFTNISYDYIFSPQVNVFIAGVLVLIQAILLNILVNHYNLLGRSTSLPALMYIVICSLFTPFLILSSPLICNFLIIWMLYKLLSLYKGTDAKSTAFDLGMIVALGSLLYLPFIYFFLAIWISLILFKPFNWREWLSGIIGYITVFFFLAVFYYLNDRLSQFYAIWLPLTTRFPDRLNINYYNYLILIPVIIILLLGFLKIRKNFFRGYVQIRKSFQLLFCLFLVAGLSFYVEANFQLSHFLLCAIPAAVFFSYYFLYANIRWFYESLFVLLVMCIIYFQFNTF